MRVGIFHGARFDRVRLFSFFLSFLCKSVPKYPRHPPLCFVSCPHGSRKESSLRASLSHERGCDSRSPVNIHFFFSFSFFYCIEQRIYIYIYLYLYNLTCTNLAGIAACARSMFNDRRNVHVDNILIKWLVWKSNVSSSQSTKQSRWIQIELCFFFFFFFFLCKKLSIRLSSKVNS